jgi:hypothetical protein
MIQQSIRPLSPRPQDTDETSALKDLMQTLRDIDWYASGSNSARVRGFSTLTSLYDFIDEDPEYDNGETTDNDLVDKQAYKDEDQNTGISSANTNAILHHLPALQYRSAPGSESDSSDDEQHHKKEVKKKYHHGKRRFV